jgi:hypothetical protein
MKSFVVSVAAAAAVVGAYLFLQERGRDGGPIVGRAEADKGGPPATSSAFRASTPPPGAPLPLVAAPYVAPPGGVEGEHLKAGELGLRMKALLEFTLGGDWRTMDRARAQQAIAEIAALYKPEDADYLLKVFEATKDPAFRWWFAALVRQIPDDRFADALVEVARVDPVQAGETLGWIGGPKSMANLATLADRQPDAEVRASMYGSVARAKWDGKERYFAALAEDEKRDAFDRMHALAALGRVGTDRASLDYLVATALGPERPTGDLGPLARAYPEKDLRAAAIDGVFLRGDMDAARAMLDAAESAGEESTLAKMVDRSLVGYSGPDISEILIARADRRRKLTLSELILVQRNRAPGDSARLKALSAYVEPDARELFNALTTE